MIDRDWFCLALRLFGIWLLIQSVETFVPYLLFALSGNQFGLSASQIVGTILWAIGRTAIGLVLVLFAPAIAARFYPHTADAVTSRPDAEARPLKVGIQLLGVFALLLAVQSGAGVIYGILSGNSGPVLGADYAGADGRYTASLLNFGLNIAFASILLIWNESVVTLIEKFRYIPERDAYERPLDE